MGFLFGLLDNPLVPWVVGPRGRPRGLPEFALREGAPARPGPASSREDLIGKDAGPPLCRGQARAGGRPKLKKQENYLAAGKLLEDAGPARRRRPRPTSRARSTGRRPPPSRSWAGRAGRRALPPGRRPQEGGALLIQAGKPATAAVLFLEKGNNLEAARLFGLAGQWDKAADLYAKSGYPLRAAEAYEKDGELAEGGRGLREALHGERLVLHHLLLDRAQPGDQKSALRRAGSTRRPAQLERAVTVYAKGSYFKRGGRGAPEARPAGQGGRALHARRGPRERGRGLRAGGRRGARGERCAARWPSRRDRAAGGRRALREGPRLPARGRAVRVGRDAGRGGAAPTRRARAGRRPAASTCAPASRRRRPRRTRGRASSRPRPSSTRRLGNAPKATELYGRAGLHLQERRGRGAGGRPREGDRAAPARAAERREPPRRDRAPGAALHRDRPAGARRRSACSKAIGGEPVSAAQPRPLLLAGASPTRRLGARGRGARPLQEDPGRGPAVPRRGRSAWRLGPAAGGRPRSPRRGGAPPRRRRLPPAAPAARRRRRPRAAARRRPRFAPQARRSARGPLGVVLPRRGHGRRPQRRPARAAAGAPRARGRPPGAGRPT